jgi:hypothetical protein
MPEIRREVKSCHRCGVEAIDNCVAENKHIPFSETLPPCKFCVRNKNRPKVSVIADFYDKMWTLDTDRTPIIEDPDVKERSLLKILHAMTTGERFYGGEQLAKCR